MKQQRRAPNDSNRVSTATKALPEHVRGVYRDEMKPILAELHALLPRLRARVRPAQYAAERAEVMILTACFCDTTLDLDALEASLQRLRGH